MNIKPADNVMPETPTNSATQAITSSSESSLSSRAKNFIQSLWQEASIAAKPLGLDPAVLLAQAGLETHWGEKILKSIHGVSSNNLFNIKSTAANHQNSVQVQSLEQRGDTLIKESASFKRYQNTLESFLDYVNLIKNHARYQAAAQAASQPTQFLNALQKAGYATDVHYAEKIQSILAQPSFQHWVQEVKNALGYTART